MASTRYDVNHRTGLNAKVFVTLKQWARIQEPDVLALTVCEELQVLKEFLTQDHVSEDCYVLLVKILHHMISSECRSPEVMAVFYLVFQTPFPQHHLAAALVVSEAGEHEAQAREALLDSLLDIFDFASRAVPAQTSRIITGLSLLKSVCDDPKLAHLALKLNTVASKARQIYKKKKTGQQSRLGLVSAEKVPDDYLTLPVLPTVSEIKEDTNIFLRPVVLEGGYKDKRHYLDVQFRLMKQDFVIPLRLGIREFQKSGMKKHFKSSELRMYYGVHILGMVPKKGNDRANDDIEHALCFDTSRLKSVRWDLSKRLMFGCLVCLSNDGFVSMALATVSNREVRDLRNGFVNVNFKSGLGIILNSTADEEFVMAETVAFFESYCHVLEGLQEMHTDLPLEEYIVGCEKAVKPPQYLLEGVERPCYDLSPFMKRRLPLKVPVLHKLKWPPSDMMCLNRSQREAAHLALTNRLAVIQGPPGTGKTYVGLKVMQKILENQLRNLDEPPVLVVCYTNHALDQFLEGILQFCPDGIVRVGGRSKSERLEPYNLKNVRKSVGFSKKIRDSRRSCDMKLGDFMTKIQAVSQDLEQLKLGVCREADLISYNVVHEAHHQSLVDGGQDNDTDTRNALGQWLNVRTEHLVDQVASTIENNMTRLILAGNFPRVRYIFSPHMPIEARAVWYLDVLPAVVSRLEAQIASEKRLTTWDSQINIQWMYGMLETCRKEILPDSAILPAMDEKHFQEINSLLRKAGASFPDDATIKTWLLGLHKGQYEQLMDIETLQAQDFGAQQKQKVDDVTLFDADFDDDGDVDEEYIVHTKALRNNLTVIMQRLRALGLEDKDEQIGGHDGSWEKVSKPLSYARLRRKVKATEPMTTTNEAAIKNVWDLDMKQRYALYKLWIERSKAVLSARIKSLVVKYTKAVAQKDRIKQQETACVLRRAQVVGMTTTGAARHRSALQTVGCKIIVVEEAAEVLEAHIVTALNKHCEHLILIGDHQQLRPNPVVYELARNYGLEISLFERLVKNQFPHVVLQEQHRMRPEISQLMRHIYPCLEDHPHVTSYGHIQGIARDVFLVQHTESERSVEDTRSRANSFEASYAAKLCSYLLLQGYEPSQITILATYTGQVLAIKQHMALDAFPCASSVRLTSVDNFQGEESDIVILSLVRSNEDNNIGFLKVDNRVCVALSRAKKGLYVLGNLKLLSSQSKLWRKILSTAREHGIVGEGLPVVCSNHPEKGEVLMFAADDFDSRPLGGCGVPCGFRLKCGHVCKLTCHGYDQLHENYLCGEPCTKSCSFGHPCPKKCSDDCGDCTVKVLKTLPSCGHTDSIPCHVIPLFAVCSLPCEHILDGCGHQCPGRCGQCREEGAHAPCTQTSLHQWPCGHKGYVKCHESPPDYPCPYPCETILDCGHRCKGSCGFCLQGEVHLACGEFCDKFLPCGHPCSSYCSTPCDPCPRPCPKKCRHSSCERSRRHGIVACGHICPPCNKKCFRSCRCKSCSKLCFENCSSKPCNKSCHRRLTCGHGCSGLCGELCVCASCDNITVLSDHLQGSCLKPDATDTYTENKHEWSSSENKNVTAPSENPTTPNDMSPTAPDQLSKRKFLSFSEVNEGKQCGTENLPKHGAPLLLKLPTCDHVFFVNDLDRYVYNFDPDGCSFIPCPKCELPIQKCTRYERLNQVRETRRNHLKNVLLIESEVQTSDLEALANSKRMLRLSSNELAGLRYLDPYAVQYRRELLTSSYKLKLAFVLESMQRFQLFRSTSQLTNWGSTRKEAVLRIGHHVTAQQKREFTIDFVSSICLAVVMYVEEVDKKNEFTPAYMIEMIEKEEPTMHSGRLNKLCCKAEQRINSFLRSKTRSPGCTSRFHYDDINQVARTALQVLRSHDNEFLCDVISHGDQSGTRARRTDPRMTRGRRGFRY